jgi:hypothetical protein
MVLVEALQRHHRLSKRDHPHGKNCALDEVGVESAQLDSPIPDRREADAMAELTEAHVLERAQRNHLRASTGRHWDTASFVKGERGSDTPPPCLTDDERRKYIEQARRELHEEVGD